MQKTTKNYDDYLKKVNQITLVAQKIFALPSKDKEGTDAVE